MNEQQSEFFKKLDTERKLNKKQKEQEAIAYKSFINTPVYKQLKEELEALSRKPCDYQPTQEGLLVLHGHTKFNEGLLEFFNICERKAKQ